MAAPTRILSQLLVLPDDPDDITVEDEGGQVFIVLGTVRVALGFSSQAAVDKLATVVAEAAAANRAHTLKAVS